jgi:RNA polymerase sigma-70 factor (ECF subfamily)
MSLSVEQLWTEFGHDLRGFIRTRVRDHAAAEDILQDVFVKIHERLPSLRDGERVEAWMYQVARNAVADHFRRGRPTEELSSDLGDSATPMFTELPDLTSAVRRFVEQLPADFREALLATEWEGLTQADYAHRTGLSISGAKSRVQRARAELKRLLDDCCRFELDRRGNVMEAIPKDVGCTCLN